MRLMRDVPKLLVVAVALVFYFARIDTGWTVPDESALRFIFFVIGVFCAPHVFQLADSAHANVAQATFVGSATLAATRVITPTPLNDLRAYDFRAGTTGYFGGQSRGGS